MDAFAKKAARAYQLDPDHVEFETEEFVDPLPHSVDSLCCKYLYDGQIIALSETLVRCKALASAGFMEEGSGIFRHQCGWVCCHSQDIKVPRNAMNASDKVSL